MWASAQSPRVPGGPQGPRPAAPIFLPHHVPANSSSDFAVRGLTSEGRFLNLLAKASAADPALRPWSPCLPGPPPGAFTQKVSLSPSLRLRRAQALTFCKRPPPASGQRSAPAPSAPGVAGVRRAIPTSCVIPACHRKSGLRRSRESTVDGIQRRSGRDSPMGSSNEREGELVPLY